uniref:Uncharacterized protein n=1 Tax=Romanomermis culicivorax TaxID=13658 RepID=A0A915JF25_ROMCU
MSDYYSKSNSSGYIKPRSLLDSLARYDSLKPPEVLFRLKANMHSPGILDVLWISAAFGRGVHLFLTVKDNPMAVSWFVVSTLMAVLGCFSILAMFYGMWKEESFSFTFRALIKNMVESCMEWKGCHKTTRNRGPNSYIPSRFVNHMAEMGLS